MKDCPSGISWPSRNSLITVSGLVMGFFFMLWKLQWSVMASRVSSEKDFPRNSLIRFTVLRRSYKRTVVYYIKKTQGNCVSCFYLYWPLSTWADKSHKDECFSRIVEKFNKSFEMEQWQSLSFLRWYLFLGIIRTGGKLTFFMSSNRRNKMWSSLRLFQKYR